MKINADLMTVKCTIKGVNRTLRGIAENDIEWACVEQMIINGYGGYSLRVNEQSFARLQEAKTLPRGWYWRVFPEHNDTPEIVLVKEGGDIARIGTTRLYVLEQLQPCKLIPISTLENP